MIDTHSHIYLTEDFPAENPALVVDRAVDAGVSHIIMPGVDRQSLSPMLDLYRNRPKVTSFALGLHPSEVTADWQQDLREIFLHEKEEGLVAIGETGLDLHEEGPALDLQKRAFKAQLLKAHELTLPVIIHQREALAECLEVLKEVESEGKMPTGLVFHCFTSGVEDARTIMQAFPQAFFGIGGVATFKNAGNVREAVREIGLRRIVLETDAPWLAPVPKRGRRNESSFLPYIAASLADTLGADVEEVERRTDANARLLFNLK